MQIRLDITVLSGISAGDVFHFDLVPLTPISIGRAPDNDLVLQDPTVSRKHAQIELRDDGIYLADLGSSHGTVHMGFRLHPGDASAREIHDDDEFKVGEALFRLSFNESAVTSKKKKAEAAETEKKEPTIKTRGAAVLARSGKAARSSPRRMLVLGALAVLALLLLFMPDNGGGPSLPKQKSKVVMNLPQLRVIGYYGVGRRTKKTRRLRDFSHLDKAQFNLPSSDMLIEYEYRSVAPVNVLFDDIVIERLKPNADHWEYRQIVVRDPLIGTERKLIFDNLDYPRKGKKGGKIKRWAIKNVRTTPLERGSTNDFNESLRATLGLSERLDKSPDALFTLIRALQKSILEALIEMNLDSVGFASDLDRLYPSVTETKQILQGILNERRGILGEKSAEALDRHLNALVQLTSDLDAELWKRSTSRLNKARLASEATNYIAAHDHLIAVKSMIPDEADDRWRLADEMFHNKKVVPKKVRMNPGKYRRALKG